MTLFYIMPAAIAKEIKTNVIKQWLEGESRDAIAADNQIGAGTVSGIINEFKKGVDALEYESLRELSISCKKQDINLGALNSSIRINNYIQKLGANQDETEAFIADVANSPEPKKLFDAANQIVQISMSESISPEELGNHFKQKVEEKQRLEEEIKQRHALLESTNVDIMTLKQYKKLEEELHKHGFSMQHPHNLISVLQTIHQIGYDPKKIVSVYSRIKSLRQTERQLNNSCKALECKVAGFREVLPLCEQVMHARIGFPELLAFHAAVMKKADMEKISYSNAAYGLMDGIDTYGKLIDAKTQLNDTIMNIQMVNLFLARQNNAINALMNLQAFGITEKEILNVYEFLNSARLENSIRQSASSFKSDQHHLRNNGSNFGAPK